MSSDGLEARYGSLLKVDRVISLLSKIAYLMSFIFLLVSIGLYEHKPLLVWIAAPTLIAVFGAGLTVEIILDKKINAIKNILYPSKPEVATAPILIELLSFYEKDKLNGFFACVGLDRFKGKCLCADGGGIDISFTDKCREIRVFINNDEIVVNFDEESDDVTYTENFTSELFTDTDAVASYIHRIVKNHYGL